MRARHGRSLLVLLLLLLLPLCGLAQQEAPPVTPPPVDAAPPVTPATGTRPVTIRAERFLFLDEQGLYQFIGNVSVESEDVTIHAAEAVYDNTKKVVSARGNVSITLPDGNTYWGRLLEFNVTTREWQFLDWSVEYPTGFLGQPFIGPLFVAGRGIGGTELNQTGLPNAVHADNARVTTCELPTPHYFMTSRRIDIYPGDKLVAYDTDVYVLGRRVLHIPWFYLSLKLRRTPFVPEAGQNDYEGYYLRVLYQYVVNPANVGGVRVDLTQKLGTGVGVNHFYAVPGGDGEAFLYGRQGLSELVARVDHTQHLPRAIDLTVRGDLRRNSLFSSQPTTNTNLDMNLVRNTTHSQLQLTTTRSLQKSYFLTDNTNANLSYTLTPGNGNTFNYSSVYSSFGQPNSGLAGDQELWNRMTLVRRLSMGTLNLRYDARTDLDGENYTGDNFFSGLQRLPEVYLDMASTNLPIATLRRIPSTVQVGWGHFDEEPGNTRLDRYLLNWQTSNLRWRVNERTTITPQAGVRQTFYGDDDFTALYRYRASLPIRQTFGQYLTNTLSYTKQEAHGYTPFRFDSNDAYPYELATESLAYNNNRNLRMNLTGGRDIQNNRWQDASFFAGVDFTRNITMTQAVAYDLNNGRWRDLVSQYHFGRDELLTVDLGTRYDLPGQQLRTLTTNVDWVVGPQWRVQWLGSYDGIRHTTLYNEFLVVRDLHCWDAAIYYSFQRKYVYLYFRLKALNLPLPGFGIGRNGQVLDTAQGLPF